MILDMWMLTAILGLVKLAWAMPADAATVNSTAVSFHPSGDSVSTCDPPTFAESSNTEAADWRECASLYSSWNTQNGVFKLSNDNAAAYTPILQTTDCTLSVKATDPSKGPFTIGDKDVKNLLGTSLRQYSQGTDLRVMGTVQCAAARGQRGGIDWRISKS